MLPGQVLWPDTEANAEMPRFAAEEGFTQGSPARSGERRAQACSPRQGRALAGPRSRVVFREESVSPELQTQENRIQTSAFLAIFCPQI